MMHSASECHPDLHRIDCVGYVDDSSHSRYGLDRERVIERERIVPVPVPVPVEPRYDTYRYVDGPRRLPAPSPPRRVSPPRRMIEDDRTRIFISDREREYYRR
ncbi:hypothetical protein CEP53_013260 [Fusarium sp. AF-6]|nr:hypothetical protein CEP53_013260 [Fusarium sp. AF-6]